MTNHDQNENEGLETRTQIFLQGVARHGEPIVDKIERTGLSEGGLREDIIIRLKYASGCHHTLHTAQETGAVCGCCYENLLCAECSKNEANICSLCKRVTCGSCQRESKIDGEKKMVCISCRRTLFWRGLLNVVKWMAVAFALLMLLQILAR